METFRCERCKKNCKSTKDLDKHILKECQQCEKCHRYFQSMKALGMHKTIGKCVSLICDECEKPFPSILSLKRHKLVHSDEKSFKCSECGEYYKYSRSLSKHLRKCHQTNHNNDDTVKDGSGNDGKLQCPNCLITCDSKRDLLAHNQLYCSQCRSCLQWFRDQTGLRNHTIADSCSLLRCNLCGQDFQTTQDAMAHKRKHMDPTYQNENNDAQGTQESTENADTSNAICDKCHTKFASSEDLKKHKLLECVQCDGCPRYFKNQRALKNHKIQGKCLIHKCEVCGKFWETQSELELHNQTHNNDNHPQFKCNECGRRYFRKSSLSYHVKNVHFATPDMEKSQLAESVTDTLTHFDGNVKLTNLNPDTGRLNFLCQKCDKICYSVEEFRNHSHSHAKITQYFRSKQKTRLSTKAIDVFSYDDLSKWTIDGFEPQYRCGICFLPFHCILMKALHVTMCGNNNRARQWEYDLDVEDNNEMDPSIDDPKTEDNI